MPKRRIRSTLLVTVLRWTPSRSAARLVEPPFSRYATRVTMSWSRSSASANAARVLCATSRRSGVSAAARKALAPRPRNVATGLLPIERAARAARSMGSNPVATFRGLGARAFLAAADTPDLRDVAHNTLAALADAEDRDQLIVTLVAYLENGGSTSRAAERLGVHRNTVTSRVDRIRRFGIPLDDPDRRLELHVACYLITPRGADPRVLPEIVSPATLAP